MHFNPPTPGNNSSNPFWHPLNQKMNEELKSIDKKVALDVYNKLKKGDRVEVLFDNAIRKGSKPFELVVTSPHRVVGKSKVGRIILINPENPRGMKYKLFNRDGNVSLAQGDMGTLLKDLKIVKEDVQLDEETRHTVHVKTDRAGYRKLEAMIASLDGYKESEFEKEGKASFTFDAKKHDAAERKKVAEFIKSVRGAEFSHAIKEDTELEEELKSLFDVKPTSKDWMKGKLRTAYNQTNKGVTKEVMKKGQVIDLHPFDGDRFVGSPDRKDKGKYFFIAKYNVDAMKEEVELDENAPATKIIDAAMKRIGIGYKISGQVIKVNPLNVGRAKEELSKVLKRKGTDMNKTGMSVVKDKQVPLSETVELDENKMLMDKAIELGRKAFKAGKKREPIGDSNLMSLKGFAKGKDKNEVMKQWLKGWDEMNLKDDVQIDEKFEFQFADKETAQKFMREVMQKRLGNSTGTRDGQVTTMTNSGRVGEPTMAHKEMAKIMKKYGGKLTRTDEGPPMAKVFEEVELDEREKTEYIMKKKGGNKYSILRQTKSGPIGMFHDLDKKAAENIMKKLEGSADARDRRERGIPDVKGKYAGQRLFASYEGEDGESIDEMSAKAHYNKMKAQGKLGGMVVTPIDRDRFPNREKEGLEGPFRSKKSGQVYYYDRKAGKYYDPLSDMYLQVRDVMESSELEEMKRPMGVPGKMPMKGKFTDDQIDKLRDAYGKIGKINPTSQSYKNLTDYLDNLPDQVIKQLATVKPRVPFISGLALNRMVKRGIK